jgi:hypothetical protein
MEKKKPHATKNVHIIGFLTGIPFGAAWSKNLARNLLITATLFLTYLLKVIFIIPLIAHALT